jgi:hypothetical protein
MSLHFRNGNMGRDITFIGSYVGLKNKNLVGNVR